MLIVLSGVSGSGKNTVIEEILKTRKDFKVFRSAITRPPRENEEQKGFYIFVSPEDFLKKVEERVSKDAIDRFYSIVKPMIKGNRWYDHDSTLSLTIELLRVVPRDIQRQAANNFIQILQTHGVNVEKAE